jgi:catechol 2,3-dioxygenase-like lactoylglutathione lyase family enzyme
VADYIISGIQQAGIGVRNVKEAFKWYNSRLGMDIPVFEEEAVADLMLPYTGGKPHERHAILAINLAGGGGFEIWQYTSRSPQPPPFQPLAGDLGIFCIKLRSGNIETSYNELKASGVEIRNEIIHDPSGRRHFYFQDPYGNLFEVVEDTERFARGKRNNAGVAGAVIGVTNLERSKRFYAELLGYNKVLFEGEAVFKDMSAIPGGDRLVKRAILAHSEPRKGPFSKLLGGSYIELIEAKNVTPRKIFEGRFWGDLGFIHLCFDVKNMDALKKKSASIGHPFTIDGGAGFEMGEAAGHFCYAEDPDGTLIEFVETKKIPLLKKIGWYLDLTKRDPQKPLPDWMLKTMRFSRQSAE